MLTSLPFSSITYLGYNNLSCVQPPEDVAVLQNTSAQLWSIFRALAPTRGERWRFSSVLCLHIPDVGRSGHRTVPFQEQIAPADNFLAQMHALLINISITRNTLAPISYLPLELVLEVFLIHRDSCPNEQWITVTHVSRYWRDIGVNYGPLWTCINLLSPSAPEFVRRAGTLPLTVRVARPYPSHSNQSLLRGIIQSGALKVLCFTGSHYALWEVMRDLEKCPKSISSPPAARGHLRDLRLLVDPSRGAELVKLQDYDWSFLQPLTVLHLSGWMPSGIINLFSACPALRELRLDMHSRPFGSLDTYSRRSSPTSHRTNKLLSDTPSWLQLLPELRTLCLAKSIILSSTNSAIRLSNLVQLDLMDESDVVKAFLGVLIIPSTCQSTLRFLPSSNGLDDDTAPVWEFLRKCGVERQLDTVAVAHVIGGAEAMDAIEVTFSGKAIFYSLAFALGPTRTGAFFDLYVPGICSFAFRKLVISGPPFHGFDEESRWIRAFASLTATTFHIKSYDVQSGFFVAFNDRDFLANVNTLVIEELNIAHLRMNFRHLASNFLRELNQRLQTSPIQVVFLRCSGGESWVLPGPRVTCIPS